MRLVVDTNVLLSALLSTQGTPGRLISRLVDGEHTFLVSRTTMEELRRVLNYPKIRRLLTQTENELELFLCSVELSAVEVDTTVVPTGLECRDPDDIEYLAVAVLGHAECIVSGDQDLLVLNEVEGIPILTPAQLLDRMS